MKILDGIQLANKYEIKKEVKVNLIFPQVMKK